MRHFKSAQWRYRFETSRSRLVQARSRYAKPHLSRNDAVGQASRLSQTSKKLRLEAFFAATGSGERSVAACSLSKEPGATPVLRADNRRCPRLDCEDCLRK